MYNDCTDKIFQTTINLATVGKKQEITSESVGFDLEELFDKTAVCNVTLICKVGPLRVLAQMTNVNARNDIIYFHVHQISGDGETLSCVNRILEFKKKDGKYYISSMLETE